MSNFKEHSRIGILAGFLFSAIVFYFTRDVFTSLLSGVTVYAGANFSDVDHQSKPAKFVATVLFIYITIVLFQTDITKLIDYGLGHFGRELDVPNLHYSDALLFAWIFIFIKTLKHRGLTHKYALPCAIGALAFITGNILYASFSVGLIVHYYEDKIHPGRLSNWF
jgi:uncharacterized membrane protein YoaK (UPF0700 family)